MSDMDCDDVILVLARGDATLTGVEDTQLHEHVEGCESCRRLAAEAEADDRYRWVARLPEDALDDPDLLVLPIIDPIVFDVDQELASGGMGRITRARDRRLGRDVAIKEMLDPDMRARFEREAMITARLQHPAIVPIYEAGTWPNGSPFYTMRLVPGGTLAAAIDATGTLAERLALLPHVVAVTEALAYAHSRNIIHRDLKPQNVLVGEFGETVVIDWGLAKELDHDVDVKEPLRIGSGPDLTMAGAVVGTPCFMPPEQAAGDELDARADVFALGAILYNVITGEPPYWDQPRETPQQLIDAVIQRPPTPLADRVPEVPADLRAIVDRAMARAKADRFPSARELAEELRRFQNGQLLRSRDYRIRDLVARWIRRHRAPVIVGSIAALVLAVVGVAALVGITRSRDAERVARHATEASVAGLFEEQGRSELVAGNRDRALAYLAEAYTRGRDTVALRHMLAETTRDLDVLESTLDPATGVIDQVGFLADGRLAALEVRDTADLELWDGAHRIALPTGIAATRAAFAADGIHVAVHGRRDLVVWDLAQRKELWRMQGELAETKVVIDRTSRWMVIVSAHQVELRDLVTGRVAGALDVCKGERTVAADFALTGTIVAVACAGGKLRIVPAQPFAPELELAIPHDVVDIVFAGMQIAAITEREVHLVSIEGNPTRVLGGQRDKITAFASTPAGDVLAIADGSHVQIRDNEGAIFGDTTEPRGSIDDLQFSPDKTLLAGAGFDPRGFVWNTAMGERGRLPLPGEPFRIQGLAWSLDGSHLATIDDRGTHVHVWKLPRSSLLTRVHSASLGVGGARVVSIGDEHRIEVRDLATGALVTTPEPMSIEAWSDPGLLLMRDHLSVTADGTRALGWGVKLAIVYDLATGHRIRELAASAANTDTTWTMSRTGERVAEIGDHVTRVFDVATGRVVFEHAAGDSPGADLSPDGTRLVLADRTMHVWQLGPGAPAEIASLADRDPFPVSDAPPLASLPLEPMFDPTGRRVIVNYLRTPVVFDVATARPIASLRQLNTPVGFAVWARDGARVMTQAVGTTALATLWDLGTGKAIFSIPGTTVHALAMTPDASRVATGYPDGTIRIWDGSGRLIETVRGNHAQILQLAFSDDGTRLVAQGRDGFLTMWDVHLERRSPAEIAALAARSGWQVVNGELVRARK